MGQQGPLVAALKQCSKHIGEKRWIRETFVGHEYMSKSSHNMEFQDGVSAEI